jgi:DNA topoisomerase-3
MRLQRKFDIEGVVSYGPCQFPTLGFVVERWARIETFVPEDFWFLQLTIRVPTPNENVTAAPAANNDNAIRPIHFTWKRTRLYDRAITMAL